MVGVPLGGRVSEHGARQPVRGVGGGGDLVLQVPDQRVERRRVGRAGVLLGSGRRLLERRHLGAGDPGRTRGDAGRREDQPIDTEAAVDRAVVGRRLLQRAVVLDLRVQSLERSDVLPQVALEPTLARGSLLADFTLLTAAVSVWTRCVIWVWARLLIPSSVGGNVEVVEALPPDVVEAPDDVAAPAATLAPPSVAVEASASAPKPISALRPFDMSAPLVRDPWNTLNSIVNALGEAGVCQR